MVIQQQQQHLERGAVHVGDTLHLATFPDSPPTPQAAHDLYVLQSECTQQVRHMTAAYRGEYSLEVLLQDTMQLVGLAGRQAQGAVAVLLETHNEAQTER